jgi:hypothetical protein
MSFGPFLEVVVNLAKGRGGQGGQQRRLEESRARARARADLLMV